MPSERTLIDAIGKGMVRAGRAWLDAQASDMLGWADVPDEVFARAALQAIHGHGPTQRMLEAARSAWATNADHYTANTARYLAMLAAELEERQ